MCKMYPKVNLARIAVHYDKIASVTRKAVIHLTAFCTATYIDHFADHSKMVRHGLLTYFASDLCSGNNLLEIAPLRILQNALQLAGEPILVSVFVGVFNVVE